MLWTNHFTQWKNLLFLSRLRRTSNVILKVANKELVEAFPTILDCSLSTPTLALDWSLKLCRPDSIWELDLSLQLFQFFFTGMKNQSRFYRRRRKTAITFFQFPLPRIYLPDKGDIFSSGMRRNFSKITNDISFTGGSRARKREDQKKSSAPLHLAVLFTVFLGTLLLIFWTSFLSLIVSTIQRALKPKKSLESTLFRQPETKLVCISQLCIWKQPPKAIDSVKMSKKWRYT